MAWLRRFIVQPLRRAWTSTPLLQRLRSRRPQCDGNFSKLYYHVQSCGYEDVQIMWTMLHPSHQMPSPGVHKFELPSLVIHQM
ncbi:hypothetical protein KP509_21G021000 [Ceratopteris richardii]|uniref:Uncharacterized protein n=1 Tax=Ceratopteris richardii TaxID=49495 RepID=A0A8T2S9Y1_CERRI|nr:hypothetical protein KP509_21G021000 [Ceratopteris richardii]